MRSDVERYMVWYAFGWVIWKTVSGFVVTLWKAHVERRKLAQEIAQLEQAIGEYRHES